MSHYIRKHNYETTIFEDEWIILNTDTYTLTRLNDTGGFCWSLLDEAQTLESLSKAVSAKYGKEGCAVEKDIELFLTNLLECGLIKHVV